MMPAEHVCSSTSGLAVVTLPDEVDLTDADRVAADLLAAFAPGVTTVIGDMTATTFCDSRGVRALLLVHERAIASGAELRLVVPSAYVMRTLTVLGLDGWLAIYRSLEEALAS